jgi:hypothetical protein
MSRIIGTAGLALVAGLLVATPPSASVTTHGAVAAAQTVAATRLALNPQPEPPGKNKSKKIKKGDPNKPK